MKVNAAKRAIFDAVDLLTEDVPDMNVSEDGVRMLPVDLIEPFHDHPFRLYEGERLLDMVRNVREYGVLNPVIVQESGDGYEMLSGHNRLQAARLAGLTEIPAIVKRGLTEEEAYVYVIETNMMQRAFTELLPSERATVLSIQYEKIKCQGRRNDIRREIARLNGQEMSNESGHGVHKSGDNNRKVIAKFEGQEEANESGHGVHKSRDDIGEEYGLTGRSIARYLRVNLLIDPLKEMLDEGKMTFRAAVKLSYLSEDEQQCVMELFQKNGWKMKEDDAKLLRAEAGTLNKEKITSFFGREHQRKSPDTVSVKLPVEVHQKYFDGMKTKEKEDIIVQALDAWFKKGS
jgi:ParB family chromosome partitioning protein